MCPPMMPNPLINCVGRGSRATLLFRGDLLFGPVVLRADGARKREEPRWHAKTAAALE